MSRLDVQGVEYHFVDRGASRERPAALFLHGLFTSSAAFREPIAALSQTRRVLALDWPGHGESSVAESGTTLDDLERAVEGILDHAGESDAVLVGSSLGGIVALRFAVRRPERVRAVVAIGTPYAPESEADRERHARTLDVARRLGAAPVLRSMATRLFGATTRKWRPEIVRGWLEEAARVDLPSVEALSCAAVTRGPVGALRRALLVVHGDEDLVVPLADAGLFGRSTPGATLEVVPECGHSVPLEDPRGLTLILSRFLEVI